MDRLLDVCSYVSRLFHDFEMVKMLDARVFQDCVTFLRRLVSVNRASIGEISYVCMHNFYVFWLLVLMKKIRPSRVVRLSNRLIVCSLLQYLVILILILLAEIALIIFAALFPQKVRNQHWNKFSCRSV